MWIRIVLGLVHGLKWIENFQKVLLIYVFEYHILTQNQNYSKFLFYPGNKIREIELAINFYRFFYIQKIYISGELWSAHRVLCNDYYTISSFKFTFNVVLHFSM